MAEANIPPLTSALQHVFLSTGSTCKQLRDPGTVKRHRLGDRASGKLSMPSSTAQPSTTKVIPLHDRIWGESTKVIHRDWCSRWQLMAAQHCHFFAPSFCRQLHHATARGWVKPRPQMCLTCPVYTSARQPCVCAVGGEHWLKWNRRA